MFNDMSRYSITIIYALTSCFSHSNLLLEEMGTTRRKSTANKDKNDFSQGLRCLAHLIAEVYLRDEQEKITRGKRTPEVNNGNN